MIGAAAVKIVRDVFASRAQSVIREALKMRLKSSGVLNIASWAPVLFVGRVAMDDEKWDGGNTIQRLKGPNKTKLS